MIPMATKKELVRINSTQLLFREETLTFPAAAAGDTTHGIHINHPEYHFYIRVAPQLIRQFTQSLK